MVFYTLEYYTVERKKELLPLATVWMELESIMLNEISQAVKDKYHDLTYKWNLINKQTSEQNRIGDMEIENELKVTGGWGWGCGW